MRPLAVGQVWVRRNPEHTKIITRYLVRSVHGHNAVCDVIDEHGRPQGLRVVLPDSWLCRYESGPLPRSFPIDEAGGPGV